MEFGPTDRFDVIELKGFEEDHELDEEDNGGTIVLKLITVLLSGIIYHGYLKRPIGLLHFNAPGSQNIFFKQLMIQVSHIPWYTVSIYYCTQPQPSVLHHNTASAELTTNKQISKIRH